MSIRKDYIIIEGQAELLDAGYYAIAKTSGWSEKIIDAEGQEIDNPISAKDAALTYTRLFWKQVIEAYNVALAQEQAAKAAKDLTGKVLDSIAVSTSNALE